LSNPTIAALNAEGETALVIVFPYYWGGKRAYLFSFYQRNWEV